jgi:N-acetyl-anhydromuramyl-L-alanine amidase AmpD
MRRRTDYIVIHCSATPPGSDIGADEIDDWHKQRGWSGIGYHAVIRRDGQIEFGRHFDEAGAHVKGQNYRSVGVCMVGGVDEQGAAEDNFNDEQHDSLTTVIAMLQRAYPDAEVVGHRDLSPDLNGDGVITANEWIKDCPSFDVAEWMRS